MFLFCSKLARKGGTAQLAWRKGTPFCKRNMYKRKYFVAVRLHKVVLSWFNHFLKNGSWGALHLWRNNSIFIQLEQLINCVTSILFLVIVAKHNCYTSIVCVILLHHILVVFILQQKRLRIKCRAASCEYSKRSPPEHTGSTHLFCYYHRDLIGKK